VTPDGLTELDGVPLTHHRLDVGGGVRLHVVEAGPVDGTPALLLHGFPEFWYGWRKVIPALARAGYRVIVPDQRGYGSSDRPGAVADYAMPRLMDDAVAVLDLLRAGPAHVVGHDWGGGVAWALAIGRAAHVRTLTVANCPHPPTMARAFRRDLSQLRKSWYMGFFQIPWLPERLMVRAAARTLADTSAPGTFTAEELAVYQADAWATPEHFRGPLNWYRAGRYGGFPGGRVTVPAQIVWGTADHALGTALLAPSAAVGDDLVVHEVPGCSHWVPAERPDAVVTRCLELWSQHGGPDPFVYKIVGADVWADVGPAWAGSAHDLRDGFVHLSAASQVAGTHAKHFAGQTGLVCLTVDPARLPAGALRWEVSRDGLRFPHLYAPLPRAAVVASRPLA
jgi:pimeloyl-ACP methyl ester carboxylesterase/uncharacterized protein (DUF952 family)